jgi:hypothetical protein
MKKFIYLLSLTLLFGTGESNGQVIINEVISNVKGGEGGAGAPGDRNEFVELLNISPDTIDVGGWFLDDGDARDVVRAWTDSTVNDPDVIMNTTMIPSGAYAVILDPEYPDTGDGNYLQPYDFPPNTIVLTVGNTTLGNGLQNTDPLFLYDQDTLLISTYGTPSDTTDTIPMNPGDGISAERINSALPDHESNWLPSIDSTGSTPGKENSVSVGVEESNDEYRTRNVEFRLGQNTPNPFNKLTAISYHLRAPSYTILKVYDIAGRLVETLVDESQEPGVYQVEWEGKDQASGVYFYRLLADVLDTMPAGRQESSPYITTKKMILLR